MEAPHKKLKYFGDKTIFYKIQEVGKLLNGLICSRRNKLLTAVCYLLSATCFLYSYTNLGYSLLGDKILSNDARSSAMGSTSLVFTSDGSGIFTNPATLANLDARLLIVNLSENVNIFNDKWNKWTDGLENYSFKNSNLLAGYPDINVAVCLLKDRIFIGVGKKEEKDMSYKYSEELTYRAVKTTSTIINSGGGLPGYGFSIAGRALKWLSFGFTYELFSGSKKTNRNVKYFATNNFITYEYNLDRKDNFRGGNFKFGALFDFKNFSIGGYYQPCYKLNLNYTTDERTYSYQTGWSQTTTNIYQYELTIPTEFGVGFGYRFGGQLNTIATVEYHRQNFYHATQLYKTKNSIPTGLKEQRLGFSDSTNINFGVEHLIKDFIPIRYGFSYSTFYYAWDRMVSNWYKDYWDSAETKTKYSWKREKINPVFYTFSIGTGIKFSLVEFDISWEYGKRSYGENFAYLYRQGLYSSYQSQIADTDLKSVYDTKVDEVFNRFVFTTKFRW